MIGYWILAKLDINLSTEPIPDKTVYCYNDKGVCKYYKNLGGDRTGCGYLGEIMDFDVCHWDQCKVCGQKEGLEDLQDESDYVSDDYVG